MTTLTLVDREPTRLEMLLDDAGITYRQLDYWTSQNLIRTTTVGNPGSGVPRAWSDREIRIAGVIGRLVKSGVALRTAADAARAHVVDGQDLVEIGDGISLLIEDMSR